jgi:sporulation protein YlmC with PRC-barrel domain
MRNALLRTTSIAMLGFGLAAAPLAFAQDATQPSTPPAATAPAPSTGTAPAPNETVPEKMAPTGSDMNSGSDMSAPMDSTDATDPAKTDTMDSAATTAPAMETERVTIVGGTQPAGTVLATDLQGEPVENSAGEDLATLDDFVIDDEGRIVGAVVSFGGFLGMGEKQVLLPWEELTIDGDDARVVLGMSAEQIEALPAFEPVEREDATAVNAPATTTAPAPATPAPATPAQ